MRALWISGLAAVAAFAISAVGLLMAAAWWSDERYGGIGGICTFVAFLGGFGMSVWAVDRPWAQTPRLDRTSRKRLVAERQRIALEKAIRDAEREAGIR